MDADLQRDLFNQAVFLLGGTRRAARHFGLAERTIDRLCKGNNPIHTGHLRMASQVLLEQADAYRALERRLSPAFADNLTEDQRTRPPHGHAFHLGNNPKRPTAQGES